MHQMWSNIYTTTKCSLLLYKSWTVCCVPLKWTVLFWQCCSAHYCAHCRPHPPGTDPLLFSHYIYIYAGFFLQLCIYSSPLSSISWQTDTVMIFISFFYNFLQSLSTSDFRRHLSVFHILDLKLVSGTELDKSEFISLISVWNWKFGDFVEHLIPVMLAWNEAVFHHCRTLGCTFSRWVLLKIGLANLLPQVRPFDSKVTVTTVLGEKKRTNVWLSFNNLLFQ